jgi:hypothetical protein
MTFKTLLCLIALNWNRENFGNPSSLMNGPLNGYFDNCKSIPNIGPDMVYHACGNVPSHVHLVCNFLLAIDEFVCCNYCNFCDCLHYFCRYTVVEYNGVQLIDWDHWSARLQWSQIGPRQSLTGYRAYRPGGFASVFLPDSAWHARVSWLLLFSASTRTDTESKSSWLCPGIDVFIINLNKTGFFSWNAGFSVNGFLGRFRV